MQSHGKCFSYFKIYIKNVSTNSLNLVNQKTEIFNANFCIIVSAIKKSKRVIDDNKPVFAKKIQRKFGCFYDL